MNELKEGLVWHNADGMRYEIISLGIAASVVQFGYTNYDWVQRIMNNDTIIQGFKTGVYFNLIKQ